VDDNPNSTADYAQISGIIGGTGASALTKTGVGKLLLTGANTYTGVTTILGGGTAIDLNKTGTGTAILSAANTYRGSTAISAGTLKVANTTGSATGSGAVTVNSGATLAGSGSIGGMRESLTRRFGVRFTSM
jgi:fibronectin-binding autotransporter adhesin